MPITSHCHINLHIKADTPPFVCFFCTYLSSFEKQIVLDVAPPPPLPSAPSSIFYFWPPSSNFWNWWGKTADKRASCSPHIVTDTQVCVCVRYTLFPLFICIVHQRICLKSTSSRVLSLSSQLSTVALADVHIRQFHDTCKHVRWKHDQKENMGCHQRTEHFLCLFWCPETQHYRHPHSAHRGI